MLDNVLPAREAYHLGRSYYEQGKPKAANPYDTSTPTGRASWYHFKRGWDRAAYDAIMKGRQLHENGET